MPQKKQFSAKTHARSASYGRNLNKLGDGTTTGAHRPGISRSKSTDGVPGRRSKSYTKLSGLSALHPLTRTKSHQPVRQSKVVLDLHNTSGGSSSTEASEEEVDGFSDDNNEQAEPQHPEQRQREPHQLSYKAPAQFSHLKAVATTTAVESAESNKQNEFGDTVKTSQKEHPAEATLKQDSRHESQEKNDLSHYYQNMILSQSTGVVRAFGDEPFANSLLADNNATKANNTELTLKYIHSNDHISSSISNLQSNASSTNSLRQFTSQAALNNQRSSLSNESMLSFKSKDRGQPYFANMSFSLKAINGKDSLQNTPQNFSQFLRSSSTNLESRTQQKLWLQRENSLIDVTMSNNNNTTPQIRREFEKISREYTNDRRFVNPLLNSIKRIEKAANPKQRKSQTDPENLNISTNFLKSPEIQNNLTKLWIQGEHIGSNPLPQTQLQANPHIYHQQQQQQQQQQQYQQRPKLAANASYSNSLRSAAAPTTRAVDRGNQSPETKRIDLAAIRLPEEQVQKLS